MSDYPAGRARRCRTSGCDEPARALVAAPRALGQFVIVRPLPTPNPQGDLLCIDCAHTAGDVMLFRATPEPTR